MHWFRYRRFSGVSPSIRCRFTLDVYVYVCRCFVVRSFVFFFDAQHTSSSVWNLPSLSYTLVAQCALSRLRSMLNAMMTISCSTAHAQFLTQNFHSFIHSIFFQCEFVERVFFCDLNDEKKRNSMSFFLYGFMEF